MEGGSNLANEEQVLPELELKADEVHASSISRSSLVGKILSGKNIGRHVVFMITKRVWFTQYPVGVDQLSHNTFLFTFRTPADHDRIWKCSLWSINGAHLNLREWSADLAIGDIDFNLSIFWVQIHELPLCYMTKENATKIGKLFPQVLHCESSSRTNFVGKKYIRLQVEVDLRKAIPSGFMHKSASKTSWI